MTRLRAALAAAGLLAAVSVAVAPSARAVGSPTCPLGGPAGTVSVVDVVLPRGAPSLALRVTSPTAVEPTGPSALGSRSSWHLATQIALLRASDGALVASRFLQSGSSGRRAAASAGGRSTQADLTAPGAPFNHTGGGAPATLPRGHYLLVAYGSDGDRSLPNPWWSAEAAFGVSVRCIVANVPATLFDHDQTDFVGGTQATAFAASAGQGATLRVATTRRRVVGFVDAQAQFVGSAAARYTVPGRRPVTVSGRGVPFAGPPGRYSFSADWQGAFALVEVCGVQFDPPR